MIAYKNDTKLKTAILKEVTKHEETDQILQGTYGKENGIWKGCAVACSLRSLAITQKKKLKTAYSNHKDYEKFLGIPESIALLEDKIFEGLPEERAKTFPREFLESINVGADLSLVTAKFIVWNLNEVLQYAKYDYVEKAIKDVAKLWQDVIDGKIVKEEQWSAARSAAWSAESAAWSAAWSAESAARSAAWSAARSAAWSAASAAESAAYTKMADKLLDLLRECGK